MEEMVSSLKEVYEKCHFKAPGVVFNPPAEMKNEWLALGFTTSFDSNNKSKNTIAFVNNRHEVLEFLSQHLHHDIVPDTVLWLAYPKGISKIKTDIHRDTLRISGEAFGIRTVAAISIDDTWSASRFRSIEK